jgi:CHAT domain-containing protein
LANHISFNASYSDFTKNFNSNLNLVFSQNNKSIGTNSIIENKISSINNQLINKDNSAYLVFIADKKLRNLPLSLNFQVVSSLIQKQNFTNFVSNQFELLNNRFEFTLTSFFKNNDFNFNAGILYTSSNSINSLSRLVNKFEKITPSINFNGLILNDKLNWSIRTNYFIFKTTNFSIDNILDITPKLTYNTSKWDYFISGGNILNIRENNIKAK